MTISRLARPLFLSPRPLTDDHLVAVLRSLGSRPPRPGTLGTPTPNRDGVLVGLGFTSSTTMRMVATV